MNQTHFEHIAYALIFQFVIGFITGNWWVGAAFGAAFFLGREHAQAEEMFLEYHRQSRSDTKFLELRVLISPEAWNLDSVLDFVAPAVAVVCVALLAS